MSASAVASTSDAFRTDFKKYNGIHEGLKGVPLPKFVKSYTDLGKEINTVTGLSSTDITTAVAKKEALNQLKLKLEKLVTDYSSIIIPTEENNVKLEELKVRIKEVNIAKTAAAAAAKADKAAQDAPTAAQALVAAKDAIQAQIDALQALIEPRQTAFVKIVELKSNEVKHIIETVIPTKLEDIKQRIQAEHISQTTRNMVEGIETSIKTIIDDEFKRISKKYDAEHKNEIEAIKAQINDWTYV